SHVATTRSRRRTDTLRNRSNANALRSRACSFRSRPDGTRICCARLGLIKSNASGGGATLRGGSQSKTDIDARERKFSFGESGLRRYVSALGHRVARWLIWVAPKIATFGAM